MTVGVDGFDLGRNRGAVVAVVGFPVLVGLAALVEGYPLPRRVPAMAGVLAGCIGLAAIGGLVWWGYDRGLRLVPGVLSLGVVGVVGWAVLAPGVSADRVGGAVVLAGDPILGRFVGVTPLVLLVGGCGVLLETATFDVAGGARFHRALTECGRVPALKFGLVCGVVIGACSLVPGLLLGAALTSAVLLGFAVVGSLAGGTLVGYPWFKHHIQAPVAVLGVVAAAATVAVTAGGSPRGFPVAWPVWFVPGLVVGGVEATTRGVRGRLTGS